MHSLVPSLFPAYTYYPPFSSHHDFRITTGPHFAKYSARASITLATPSGRALTQLAFLHASFAVFSTTAAVALGLLSLRCALCVSCAGGPGPNADGPPRAINSTKGIHACRGDHLSAECRPFSSPRSVIFFGERML